MIAGKAGQSDDTESSLKTRTGAAEACGTMGPVEVLMFYQNTLSVMSNILVFLYLASRPLG